MNNYTAYHVHTEFSLLDSATRHEEYIQKAVSLGQKALAFSEHGNTRSWFKKKQACEKAGLKYIHAVEIYLTRSLLQESENGDMKKVRDNYHTILIAKNYEGFKEINRLVSMSTDDEHRYFVGRISFDEFLNISSNVITTSACLASPLNKLSISDPYYEKLLKRYDYLEIQPHNCQEQIDYNVHLATLAKTYNKQLIAATDAHSSDSYKDECRNVLMEYKGQYYPGEESMDLVYKSYDELIDAFRKQDAIPEELWMTAIENTNVMADSIEEYAIDTSNKYPIMYGSAESDEDVFVKNVWDSLQKKLGDGVIPQEQEASFRSALEEELRVFSKIGMAGFMQSMSEIIRWCHDNGIATGPARGSVAGSRAAYVTDIIDLNPETWNTVFSRFANEDRVELGDIDIDLIDSDRPKVFEYIVQRFGRKFTARVPTYGTIKDRKVIEIIVGSMRKKWESEHSDLSKDELKAQCPKELSLDSQNKLKEEYVSDQDAFKRRHEDIAYYIDGLMDVKISQSVHPAGMIISPITLEDNFGVFLKDDDLVLQLDMDEAHDVGLVKYDMLVLRNVQIIRDCCSLCGIPYPKSHEIDWNDEAVWDDMLRSSVGIFQMEGDFAFKLLKDFKPRSIFDMSLVTAAIRPSGASYRNNLIARKIHKNPSSMIDDLLKDNLGYLVYQENIIAFLKDICGLSGSEADTVRRCIAKKQKDKLEKWLPKIINGYCSMSDKPNDIAAKEARDYLQVIEDASAYSFGYNHSIAYCLIGYICAYLRYYHPYEFITSLLNNAANDSDIISATELASLLGIKVSPPKYGSSADEYGFDSESKRISKGAASIKFMNGTSAINLYNMAHDGVQRPYFADVLFDVFSNKIADERQIEILIKVGYFSDYGNINELIRVFEFARLFKYGNSKSYKCDKCGTLTKNIIEKYSSNLKKDGKPGTSYKFFSEDSCKDFIRECESHILSLKIEDASLATKIEYQQEYLKYIALESHNDENKRRLYVLGVTPLKSKKTGAVWTYKVNTIRLYTGNQADVYVSPGMYYRKCFDAGDILEVMKNGIAPNKNGYYNMTKYAVVK